MIVLWMALSFIAGCATAELNTKDTQITDESKPVWPSPPHEPKIKFVQSISGSMDIGNKRTWVRKAMDSILGREENEDNILRPYGVCAHSSIIYITDPGLSLVHVFDLEEKKYFRIEKVKDEDLMSPIGIAVDVSGEIFLSDSALKKVFVLDKNGKYLTEIGSPDLFARPTGLAVDDEKIYVVDTIGHQILTFSKKDGHLLFRIGKDGSGNGEFHYPTHIFIGKDRLIYVTDSLNFRVQIFDREGHFLSSFGKPGDASGNFAKPKGIAVDSEGHIYVSDSQFDNVQIFDRQGKLLLVFGDTGRSQGKMSLPAGIFIDENDKIYVADSYNNRIQIFQYLKDVGKKADK
jgi:sugar lactone lactonase YvrE